MDWSIGGVANLILICLVGQGGLISNTWNFKINVQCLRVYLVTIQVCLMSQSWNNVANMHELLTVLKLTYSEKI